MFNIKDYADAFIIKKEHDEYSIKEYIGDVEGTLSIPEGVTRISSYAFLDSKCSKINKIIFPKTLKRIPNCNFENWKHLEEVVIPEGISSIGEGAFEGTGIHEVLLPSTMDRIAKDAFAYCENLKKITLLHLTDSLLNSLMNGNYSFGYPKPKLAFSIYFGLSEDIELSKYFNKYYNRENEKLKFSIRNWFVMYGDYIVGYVGKGKNIYAPDSAIGIAPEAFAFDKGIESITLSKNIKTIGSYAFEGCSSLHTITLNESLEKIGSFAFADSGLKKIKIPLKVSFIGEGAFTDCKRLQCITIVEKLIGDHYRISKWDTWWDRGFYNEEKKEYV